MIVAMQNFIPNRLAVISEKKSSTAPAHPQIYEAAWLAAQQATTIEPQPSPVPAQQEDTPAVSACPGVPWKPEVAPESAEEAPPGPWPQSIHLCQPF